MTLQELKKKVLTLIEESKSNLYETDDPDIKVKLPFIINEILYELSRYKKIPAYKEENASENQIYDLNTLDNFYQLKNIRNVNYEDINETNIKFIESGKALITYYKYPTAIDENTSDTFTLELSKDALEIAPLGIAADLLKADVSNQYGQIYANRYKELIQTLDSRYSTGSIEMSGGTNI